MKSSFFEKDKLLRTVDPTKDILPQVVLLKAGSLVRNDAKEILDARSSVTLIVSGSLKMIVDTGLAGEEDLIMDRLARNGHVPEDIDLAVNTHMHPDHCGNNHLFTKAKFLSKEGSGNVAEGDIIAPGVWIMETPGHTMGSISVVCISDKIIIIAGDALPTLDNYLEWVPPCLHVDREKAMESFVRIADLADIVVPGHDEPFLVGEGRNTSALDWKR
jgi:N-acyl homoserine lactone hydrolase